MGIYSDINIGIKLPIHQLMDVLKYLAICWKIRNVSLSTRPNFWTVIIFKVMRKISRKSSQAL